MIRRTVIVVIAAAFLGLLGFVFLSWRPAIAPIERPNRASRLSLPAKARFWPRSVTVCRVIRGRAGNHSPVDTE